MKHFISLAVSAPVNQIALPSELLMQDTPRHVKPIGRGLL